MVLDGSRDLLRPARRRDRARAQHPGSDRHRHHPAGSVERTAPDRGDPVNQRGSRVDLDDLFVDGHWVSSTGTSRLEVVDPATEEVWGSVPDATPEDVDLALAAAT